ncbi:MAG TPA: hypothetical protein VEC01_00955 [Noviherbaspirillum sp.]|uniref:hypothetical protein n=1 Tax=Noviherbaspirillum sp. TaxID=1926288 RepID=UPI002D33AF9F|nr:hypothetical protein [Noviherbaspirillum sp.]HYD93862.1 hypothetical protein [Noviherbaspirillum sp.]
MLKADAVTTCRRSLVLLWRAETVRQAEALPDCGERFFGPDTPGAGMQGSAMHQTLLVAYDKLFAPAAEVPA